MTIGGLFETGTDWVLENAADDTHRLGLLTCLSEFNDWLRQGCPGGTYSFWVCCRYGKSDLIRNCGISAIAHKVAGQVLVIHPSPELAAQFLEPKRMNAWRQRWLPAGPRLGKITTLRDFVHRSMCGDEWLGSIHIHALLEPTPRRLLREWVDESRATYGAPPLIVFDEGQHFSARNVWGGLARQVHEAGSLVVPLTATAFRQDGDDVYAFHRELKEGSRPISRVRTYCTPHPDPTKRYLHTSVRDETAFEIRADSEVPFSQGWSEGHIAKATFDLIDWQMKGWGTYSASESRLLSELPKDEARAVLASLYRDPAVIRVAAMRVLRHLETFRAHSVPEATLVWFGMDDVGTMAANENQKAIKAVLKQLHPTLDVRIATLKTDDEYDDTAKQTIEKFTDIKTKQFDALLLKAMGVLGMDSDRICVVVLWNPVRSLAQMIQMAMRGGNSKLKSHFVIVALKDVMTVEGLQAFVEDEGGAFIDVVETDHTVVEIEKQPTTDGGYIAVAPVETGMGDTDGRTCSADEVRLALYMLTNIPELIGRRTIPMIATLGHSLGITVPASRVDTDFVDSERACDAYRENLEGKVKHLGRAMFLRRHGRRSLGTPADLAEYGELYRHAAKLIKERTGCWLSWDKTNKDRSTDPDDYRAWTMAADALLEDLS